MLLSAPNTMPVLPMPHPMMHSFAGIVSRFSPMELSGMLMPSLLTTVYENTFGGHANDADPELNARRWARHYVYLSQKLMDE